MSSPLDQMSPEELCREAAQIRSEVSKSSERLGQIYDVLYRSARRNVKASADETRMLITTANAGKRLVGVLTQAIRRASISDRAILVAKAHAIEDEERRIRAEQARLGRDKRRQAQEKKDEEDRAFRERLFGSDPDTTQDDLIELYGKD